ncbi:MAG: protein translocase subunit SecD [Candidatus Omnitrophica bacterium]|nr:protein translocase subunit SecD [Candidatus Omnitrophota bacterium]
MDKSLRNRIFVILGVTVACIFFAFPLQKHINLGLDLKGGMHLVLKVDNEKLEPKAKNDSVLRAIEVLRNRIDNLGVGETVIQRQGDNEILVQLPGVTERERALEIVGRVAQLEFRLVNDDPEKLRAAIAGNTPAGFVLKSVKKENGEPILLEDTVAMNGDTIADARVDFDRQSFGQPYISLKFNAEGANKFGTLTRNNIGRRLAIIMDNEVLSAPNIKDAILGGSAQITGQFTFEEASMLSLALRSGALPVPMHIEEERTIGPLLGQDSINAGVKAAVIGICLVFFFMLIYYHKTGIIANFALILNLLIILGTMGFINMTMPDAKLTMTLPGIAGIILALGMAVDSNILINERIREEVTNGRPLQAAITTGFARAFSAIIDTHCTSLISSFMLFQFGSGPIKGFAVTMIIGIIASLFTAIYVSKTFFLIGLKNNWIKSASMLKFLTKTKIDFIGKRYYCFALSGILILASFYAWHQKKEHIYGIDFSGGQIQQYRFKKPVDAAKVREILKANNIQDAVIQQFDKDPENIIIRTPLDTYEKVSANLKKSFPDNNFDVLRIEKVGPVVGQALKRQAILAIICALGGILIYIAFRFKHFDFAAAGVFALLHDVIIAFGAVIIANRQIDLLVVTALLTIAGYSINDTIVVYDRIRENMPKLRKNSLSEIINISINETLSRTIFTSLATLLVVFGLFFFGGEVLNTFALCLIVGFMIGTFSSVYVAAPLVLAWENRKK